MPRGDSGEGTQGVYYEAMVQVPNAQRAESSEGEDEEEPSESGPADCTRASAKRLIQSDAWTFLVMSAVVLNTVSMALQCDFEGWPGWIVLEDGFLAFFAAEIALRLYVHRCSFFTSGDERLWNIFELLVVVAGLLDTLLSRMLSPDDSGGQAVTMLRVIRIVRVLRSCRLVRHFKQLYLLVQGFLHSLQAVFWIGVLFSMVVTIAGILVTMVIGHHAEDWANPPNGSEEDAEDIRLLFGSLLRSMVTMFQMVTLDNWGDINGLVAKQMPVMTAFFILYVMCTAFAMIALLTGVITEHVNSVSQAQESADEEQRFSEYVDTLEDVFRQADAADGSSGGLNFEEIGALLEDPKVAQKMELNDTNLSLEDISDICRAMDLSGDGRVSWEEFRRGLKGMHGHATAKELALLRADVFQVKNLLDRSTGNTLATGLDGLEGRLERMEASLQRLARASRP